MNSIDKHDMTAAFHNIVRRYEIIYHFQKYGIMRSASRDLVMLSQIDCIGRFTLWKAYYSRTESKKN